MHVEIFNGWVTSRISLTFVCKLVWKRNRHALFVGSFTCANGLPRRLDRLRHLHFRMCRRDERGLKLAARQIHAAIHHGPEELGEASRIAAPGALVIRNR